MAKSIVLIVILLAAPNARPQESEVNLTKLWEMDDVGDITYNLIPELREQGQDIEAQFRIMDFLLEVILLNADGTLYRTIESETGFMLGDIETSSDGQHIALFWCVDDPTKRKYIGRGVGQNLTYQAFDGEIHCRVEHVGSRLTLISDDGKRFTLYPWFQESRERPPGIVGIKIAQQDGLGVRFVPARVLDGFFFSGGYKLVLGTEDPERAGALWNYTSIEMLCEDGSVEWREDLGHISLRLLKPIPGERIGFIYSVPPSLSMTDRIDPSDEGYHVVILDMEGMEIFHRNFGYPRSLDIAGINGDDLIVLRGEWKETADGERVKESFVSCIETDSGNEKWQVELNDLVSRGHNITKLQVNERYGYSLVTLNHHNKAITAVLIDRSGQVLLVKTWERPENCNWRRLYEKPIMLSEDASQLFIEAFGMRTIYLVNGLSRHNR